ncbi:phosphoribosylamine--glycine ligase [Halalkalibacillus sediminis]|uniref:Phosphoribosylamine--glycine ligase n=1 Tax=Halalkalibacillus sediminis TaxID=2018042 RepID=A0A2I0QQF6_9BACI|nr:phosphoribosylamine--glycine ligase [Halalkalibacillus sediminis]PKR76552.1 phosphoribosylamine--glycine ligase [Halalkalibacillus sediminis]
MKVLIIGRGGREHVLAWKVAQSNRVEQVFVAPGNDGMEDVTTLLPIEESNHNELLNFAKKEEIDLTIVGPEVPLMAGIVDHFQEANLRIFGPTEAASLIEGSKDFAKALMKKYQIPTAASQTFHEIAPAKEYIHAQGAPIVIKADGLAAGKGVVVAQTLEEAEQAVDDMLGDQAFGEAGARIVIEEFLQGEEFSLMAFVNGTNVYPMVLSQDHKRAYDNDKGPNTGGMGAYSPVPQIEDTIYEQSIEKILKPTAEALVQEERSFTGILYAGLILTEGGPKVIEFNARFGDPEAQVVLPRLENDLVDVIESVLKAEPLELQWSQDAVVGVVLASKGYPGAYEKGASLPDLPAKNPPSLLFHAGTKNQAGEWKANGGRILLVASKQPTLEQAQQAVYHEMSRFESDHIFYRKDIASKALQI